jgi:lipooligosaccharide transport system permease protein
MTAPSAAAPVTGGVLWRIVPPLVRDARRPHRLVERAAMVYRRTYLLLVSGFFEPVFYLLSMKVGLGKLIGDVVVGGRVVDYATFVAPALMASSAMNGASIDATMNVFYKLKYAKVYDAMLATPMGTGDIALGEIAWALLRGLLYSVSFLVVVVAMGLAGSPWVVLAVPACALIGFAFAAVGIAATTYMRGWPDFEFVPLALMPMFLFSATFYPASTYSGLGRLLLNVSPLYHGVELVRAASTGTWSAGIVGHVTFLAAMGLTGLWVAAGRLDGLLRD